MSIDTKHIATFLLGAAAGIAIHKYTTMSDEEKENLSNTIKDNAQNAKKEAEDVFEKFKVYFEKLGTRGSEVLKEHVTDLEKTIDDLFAKKAAE